MREIYKKLSDREFDHVFFHTTKIGKILTNNVFDNQQKIKTLEPMLLVSEDRTRDFNSVFRKCEDPEILKYFIDNYYPDFVEFAKNMTILEVLRYPYLSKDDRIKIFELKRPTRATLNQIWADSTTVDNIEIAAFVLQHPNFTPSKKSLIGYVNRRRPARIAMVELMVSDNRIDPSILVEKFNLVNLPSLLRKVVLHPLCSKNALDRICAELFITEQVEAITALKRFFPKRALDLITRYFIYNTIR